MSDVEFQGGRALEQTESMADGADANENRDAARKAVKAAIDAETKKSKPRSESADDPSPKGSSPTGVHGSVKKVKVKDSGPKESSADEDDETAEGEGGHDGHDESSKKSKADSDADDEDASAVKKVLKNRAKIAKEKAVAAEEQRKWQGEFQRQKAELDHQRSQLQQQYQYFEHLKKNPVEAVQQAGWDPESFILDIAESGTPEGKQKAQLRAMQAQIDQHKSWQENLVKAQQQAFHQAQQRQAIQFRDTVEQQFLGACMNEEKAPLTASFYKGREAALISEGDIIAAQYRELTGKEASVSDIAEYIEEQLAERANAWYEHKRKAQASQQDEEDESVAVVEPPAGAKRKSSKTLTPDHGSGERRALTKDLTGLDDEELKEIAKQNVRLAISKYKAPKA